MSEGPSREAMKRAWLAGLSPPDHGEVSEPIEELVNYWPPTPPAASVERVARAIAQVQIFSRVNDWTSDCIPGLPFELCRYGREDEDEIVVLERHPSVSQEAHTALINKERARAAIAAMSTPAKEG